MGACVCVQVIAALCERSKHVPYRNSKLTLILQDSLAGNSKMLMMVKTSTHTCKHQFMNPQMSILYASFVALEEHVRS